MQPPILFLDVDGVIAPFIWLWTCDQDRDYETIYEHHLGQIDPYCASLLNRITDATNALIVVTSVWRISHSVDELSQLFAEAGITGKVIGVTPRHLSGKRGREVHMYLENMRHEGVAMNRNFVAIDDDCDYLGFPDFIHVRGYVGLTESSTDRAIDLLSKCRDNDFDWRLD